MIWVERTISSPILVVQDMRHTQSNLGKVLFGAILGSVGSVVDRALNKDQVALLDTIVQVRVLLLIPGDNSVPVCRLDKVT